MVNAIAAPVVVPRTMPQEHDYHWEERRLGSKPSGPHHYRDIPLTGADVVDDVHRVFSALAQLAAGSMFQAGALADAMMADDRIHGVVTTRLDALAALPLEVTARSKKKKALRRADQVTDEFSKWVPNPELKRILFWGRLLNLGIGEILWRRRTVIGASSERSYWVPKVKAWDPRYAFWRWDTRSFWMVTLDGMVELTPGDGHWILFCPYGYARGWMSALIRPLGRPFLWRGWSTRDWARYSEVHGLPIKKVNVPAEATVEDKEIIKRDLQTLGSEGVIRLPKGTDAQSGYDIDLLEPTAQSFEGFARFIDKADECISVTILGQNLTTSAKTGGSYALGDIHSQVKKDKIETDAKDLGECLDEQLIRPWAGYNFDDEQLGPSVRWSTKAIEDRAQNAKTMLTLGQGVQACLQAGFNIDHEKVAKAFQLPLVDGKPTIPPTLRSAAPGLDKEGKSSDGETSDE